MPISGANNQLSNLLTHGGPDATPTPERSASLLLYSRHWEWNEPYTRALDDNYQFLYGPLNQVLDEETSSRPCYRFGIAS